MTLWNPPPDPLSNRGSHFAPVETVWKLKTTAALILEDGTRFSGFLHNAEELNGLRALQRANEALQPVVGEPPTESTYLHSGTQATSTAQRAAECKARRQTETAGFLHLHCEFVFNTALTGYEEVITDPSYGGQAIVFTTPHLGTTGWTNQETESDHLTPTAVICRTVSRVADNHAAVTSLGSALAKRGVPLISNVDTRSLTLKLREKGAMAAIIELEQETNGCAGFNTEPSHPPSGQASFLSDPIWPRAAFPKGGSFFSTASQSTGQDRQNFSVALIDFGVKRSIIEALTARGCSVTLLPWHTATLEQIQAIEAHGVLFSNGAGDPRVLKMMPERLATFQNIASIYPSFGICFGHQTLALCFGGSIDKIGFGHHAVNHPVAAVTPQGLPEKVFITSQNHNYAVQSDGLPKGFKISHRHWNDGSVAGIRHTSLPVFSVQFHPEAGPGPRESMVLFDDFIDSMRSSTK
jgi:carbamoyl-phosphate synthase small subunit